MKIRLLAVLLVLFAFPLTILAQDDTEDPIAGDYTYSGVFGDTSYEGENSITGTAPFYWFHYSETTESGETFEGTYPALAVGNVFVSALGGEECLAGLLLRQTDGTLIGFWQDTYTETASPIGIEIYMPQAETTGFAGTYTLRGSFATGQIYTATVDISENEAGWLDLTYNYESDEAFPDHIPATDLGIGMVSGNALGYSFVDAEAESQCGVNVQRFDGEGGYESVWVDDDQAVGSETGSRVE